MSQMKYMFDKDLGVLGVKVLSYNHNGFDGLLLVEQSILGEKREDFPNRNNYYTYGLDNEWYRRRNINNCRTKKIVISLNEWNNLPNSKEELLNEKVNLYLANIFNSDKNYSYVSYRELEVNNYAKVNVRGREVNGFIVSKVGKVTLQKVLEERLSFIE